MTADPLRILSDDRGKAANLRDPLCNRCFLATVDEDGNPEARTLVLRDVEGCLGIFANGSSPKCQQIGNSSTIAVLIYFDSIGVQYRIQTELSPISTKLVHEMWQKRPDVSKKLDYLYATYPQSSTARNREQLLSLLEEMPVPRVAPMTAKGFYFSPVHTIERLCLDRSDGLHSRTRYERTGDSWRAQDLVP